MKNEELREALDSLDIEYFLDKEGIAYRKTRGSHGVQLNVRECPVCGGGNWKVYLNAETGLGNCFHGDCQTKFNKWKFITASLKDLPMKDVIAYIKSISEESGWRPNRETNRAQKDVFSNTNFYMPTMIDIATAIKEKGANFASAKYLLDRGVTLESIEYFKLGDCVDGYFQYRKPDGNIGYQNYSNRIIIPIFDQDGITVSFQGRDYSEKSEKRYLFPPGLNSSGKLLYNGWNYDGQEQVVIGEGVFDCIAIRQAMRDLRQSVLPIATFGKHLSVGEGSQLSYLKSMRDKGLKVVTFMWDGEAQALRDAINAALVLHKEGFISRVARLPQDKDPNEVAPNEVLEAFWSAITVSPKTAIQFLLSLR